jgi:murein L,D-transpeptidase YafK
MRTIEIKETVELSFNYRNDASVLRENALEVKVVADLSKLSADDLLEWAYSAMVVSYQSKLRSKTPPVKGEDGKYKWAVPSRGTRSTADPVKVEEAATKLLAKMTPEQKSHQMYNILISMGKSVAEATAISGYTVPVAPAVK